MMFMLEVTLLKATRAYIINTKYASVCGLRSDNGEALKKLKSTGIKKYQDGHKHAATYVKNLRTVLNMQWQHSYP
jgi:hypothetical protein